jgi:DoxX-like family
MSATTKMTIPAAGEPPQSAWRMRVGWTLSGLTIAFMLFDSGGKLALERHVIAAMAQLGYPVGVIRALGAISLLCTLLYAIPRTAVLGAILFTAYLGGAVASKVRIEDPLFSSILFGVYFGVILWAGLYLRDSRVRALIPLTRA